MDKIALRVSEAHCKLWELTTGEAITEDRQTFGRELAQRWKELERIAHKLAEDFCSKKLPYGYWEKTKTRIEERIKALYNGKLPEGVFINGDPRGYGLKIEWFTMSSRYRDLKFERDWGGYGIPSLTK